MIYQPHTFRERQDDRLRRLPLAKSDPVRVWGEGIVTGVLIMIPILAAVLMVRA